MLPFVPESEVQSNEQTEVINDRPALLRNPVVVLSSDDLSNNDKDIHFRVILDDEGRWYRVSWDPHRLNDPGDNERDDNERDDNERDDDERDDDDPDDDDPDDDDPDDDDPDDDDPDDDGWRFVQRLYPCEVLNTIAQLRRRQWNSLLARTICDQADAGALPIGPPVIQARRLLKIPPVEPVTEEVLSARRAKLAAQYLHVFLHDAICARYRLSKATKPMGRFAKTFGLPPVYEATQATSETPPANLPLREFLSQVTLDRFLPRLPQTIDSIPEAHRRGVESCVNQILELTSGGSNFRSLESSLLGHINEIEKVLSEGETPKNIIRNPTSEMPIEPTKKKEFCPVHGYAILLLVHDQFQRLPADEFAALSTLLFSEATRNDDGVESAKKMMGDYLKETLAATNKLKISEAALLVQFAVALGDTEEYVTWKDTVPFAKSVTGYEKKNNRGGHVRDLIKKIFKDWELKPKADGGRRNTTGRAKELKDQLKPV